MPYNQERFKFFIVDFFIIILHKSYNMLSHFIILHLIV